MKVQSFLYSSYLLALALAGCKKEAFVEANTDPLIIQSIRPEEQFLNASIRANNADFEAYYDNYRRIMPWMQMATLLSGNSKTFVTDVGNFNQRYSIFYPQLGSILTDMQNIIDALPEEEGAARVHMSAIGEILKIYYAFYVSDINGSIAYNDAFQARYGGSLTPAYQTQPELFEAWLVRLDELVGVLQTAQTVPQISLGTNDLYYGGDVTKWVKAANALRVRIAMRMMKRDATKAASYVAAALAEAGQMASNDDSWVMYADVSFTQGGNWSPVELRAPKPTVDFMWENSDPRIRMFYQKNNYTQTNLSAAIAAGVYPASTVWNPRQYVGAHISPDSVLNFYNSWFTTKAVNSTLSLDTVSYLQWRMWQPASNNGTGRNFFPVITYADYCFMYAEAIVRGYVSGDAQTWYNNGVAASLDFYDAAANGAKLADYVALTDAEVASYLVAPDVAWNATKALELIAIQSYLNFYKQPNEAWALYKRTGMPNSSTALANEDIIIDGAVRAIPRRASLAVPIETDPNYSTRKPALDQMATNEGFGAGPADYFGRVWWDKP